MNAKEFNEKVKTGVIKLSDYTAYDVGSINTFNPVFNLMTNKRTGLNSKLEMCFVIENGEISMKVYTYDKDGGWTKLSVKPKTIRQFYTILNLYNQDKIDNMIVFLSYLKENITTVNYYKSEGLLKQDTSGMIVDPRTTEGQPNEDDIVF